MLNLDNIDDPDLRLLSQAVMLRASDIHLETTENAGRIRLRIDGSLAETAVISRSTLNNLIVRLKIRAQMNIAEKRLPQAGRVAVVRHYVHRAEVRREGQSDAQGPPDGRAERDRRAG